ncbi:5281_t:CDS:2 [Gigaspora margarita]|uniref:5281_t:CDS:1 n=1 Tax=Gigaspora margarita TaxID=4874 RepID=A0ABN7VXS3_GIGMA|nr:5281_t:CDS:2 [Gigaspora margarita]
MLKKANYSYSNQRKEKDNFYKTKTISFCELETNNDEEVYMINNITSQKATKRQVDPKYKKPPKIKKPLPSDKTKRKRGPSKIDSLKPYNITDDILSLPTSATVEQILHKTEGLNPNEDSDAHSDSGDTFDEFDYEEEEFNELERGDIRS